MVLLRVDYQIKANGGGVKKKKKKSLNVFTEFALTVDVASSVLQTITSLSAHVILNTHCVT